ncbi:MAG: Ig-like domain repeat protein, partial [Terracidiphilus sp.]
TGMVGTSTLPFPTTSGSYDPGSPPETEGWCNFVSKLNPDGSALVYSTYFCGEYEGDGADEIFAIAVDSTGAAYFGGVSESYDNTPTTPGSYEPVRPSDYPAPFVTKLSPDGSTLVYSTFLDGPTTESDDSVSGIAVDSSFSAYVTGFTSSASFPTTAGAFETVYPAGYGQGSAFVTKLSADGSSLVYSTFLGGSGIEDISGGRALGAIGGIALDSSNDAYVTGDTSSSNFPTKNPYIATCSSPCTEAFVSELNPTGTGLVFSTFLGGSKANQYSYGLGIAVDPSNCTSLSAGESCAVFVGGETSYTDFPVTANAVQSSPGEGFITKLAPGGTGLVYSSYFNGDVESVAVGPDDSAVLFGLSSTDLPFESTAGALTLPTCAPETGESGCFFDFISKLTVDGTGLIFSTPIGANQECCGAYGALDSTGDAYIVGSTSSTQLPTTAGSFEPTLPSGSTASAYFYVAKVSFSSSITPLPTSLAIALSPNPATAGASVTATATITGGASTVTGTVDFYASPSSPYNPVSICSQVSVANNSGSWQATCQLTEDTAGAYTIAASYSGDAMNQASNSTASLTVNQGTGPILGTVPGSTTAIAINSNNTPGLSFNAVLNNDSSVSILLDGSILPGQGCSPYMVSGSNLSVSSGALYIDFANNRIYLAILAGGYLYAAYETIDDEGNCTLGSLLPLNTITNSNLEMNVDVAQGNMYVMNYRGANTDELYIVPTAPWSTLPTPAEVNLDYDAQYGPIVIDPSNHQAYINDVGSGFFVYDPTHSGTPANNLQHVVGYTYNTVTTPFNVGTLLDNGAGKLVLVNNNPSASSGNFVTPIITVLDTTQFSFFTNTTNPYSYNNDVDITLATAPATIFAASSYTAIGGADIDIANNAVYVFAFNSNSPMTPGLLLEYNLTPGAATPETVLNGSIDMPVSYDYEGPWSQLNYDAESTEIALSANPYGSGALGITSPLCAGSPSLTQLVGNEGSPTPLDLPVVNTISGYTYAVQPGSGYPPGPSAIFFVAPPPSGCATPTPAAVTTVSGGGQSATIGAAFANPLVVKVTDASGNPVSGVTVAFTAPSSGPSASFSAAAPTASNGTTSVSAMANGIAGSSAYPVIASVAGVSTPAAFSLTNTKAATTLAVAPSVLSLLYGQMVTINAAISPSSVLTSAPTGSVAFYDGSAALTPVSTVAKAAASYTVKVPAVGSHTYSAQYLGNANFAESALTKAASTVIVKKASVILSGPAKLPVRLQKGTAGTILVTIAGQFTGSGIAKPSGSLKYSVSGKAFGPGTLLVANGTATIPVPATLPSGTYTITLSYAGDLNYNPDSIDIQLTVLPVLSIGPTLLPVGIEGGSYSQVLTAAGGSGSGYSFTVSTGTALSAVGLTLSTAGKISGTPAKSETAAAFTVKVTDSLGDTATRKYSLTIFPALAIQPVALPGGFAGELYSLTLDATGGSGGYKFVVTSGTALSAVGLTLSNAGVILGKPTRPETVAAVMVQVTDSAGDKATHDYLLTISSSPSGPITIIDPETITVNDTPTKVQLIDVSDKETVTVSDVPQVTPIN